MNHTIKQHNKKQPQVHEGSEVQRVQQRTHRMLIDLGNNAAARDVQVISRLIGSL